MISLKIVSKKIKNYFPKRFYAKFFPPNTNPKLNAVNWAVFESNFIIKMLCMQQTYTSNDLLRYLYKETSASETLAIREAILEDSGLHAEYDELRAGYQMLPKVKFRPSPAAIQNILRFSAMSAVEG